MSEISLRYLIDCYASDGEAWEIKHYSLSELMNARIARAEAAERLAEAFEAAYAIGEHSADDGLLDAAYNQYAAAREAVRKLEEKDGAK